jgi:hypothetical protein
MASVARTRGGIAPRGARPHWLISPGGHTNPVQHGARSTSAALSRTTETTHDRPRRLTESFVRANASTTNYIRHLRALAERHVGWDPALDGIAANVEWKRDSIELLKARLARDADELLPTADVREVWGSVERGLRNVVMGLPSQFAAEIPELTDHDVRTIERLCRDLLEDTGLERGYMRSREEGDNDDEGQG